MDTTNKVQQDNQQTTEEVNDNVAREIRESSFNTFAEAWKRAEKSKSVANTSN